MRCAGQVVVGPCQLGDVVAVDQHRRAGRPQEVLGRLAASHGRRRPAATSGVPAGRADVDERPEAVGEAAGRAGEVAQLGDLGARHPDAAALGAVGEQGVALSVGGRGPRRGPRRARPRCRPRSPGPPRPGRWRGGRRAGPRRAAPRRRSTSAARRRGFPPLHLDLPAELVEPGLQLRPARPWSGSPPARPPPVGARPAAGRRRRLPARRPRRRRRRARRRGTPTPPRAAAIRCRSGRPAPAAAPAARRRRKSGSASMARRSVPSAASGIRDCFRNGFSGAGYGIGGRNF